MTVDGYRDDALEACPNCRSSQIYSRMVVTPRYRCSQCAHEFAEPMRRRFGDGPKRHG